VSLLCIYCVNNGINAEETNRGLTPTPRWRRVSDIHADGE